MERCVDGKLIRIAGDDAMVEHVINLRSLSRQLHALDAREARVDGEEGVVRLHRIAGIAPYMRP